MRSLLVRTRVLIAERRSPPIEFLSDLQILNGQLAPSRYFLPISLAENGEYAFRILI